MGEQFEGMLQLLHAWKLTKLGTPQVWHMSMLDSMVAGMVRNCIHTNLRTFSTVRHNATCFFCVKLKLIQCKALL